MGPSNPCETSVASCPVPIFLGLLDAP